MFLRRNRRRKDGEAYEYWTLVETAHTARGPRQRIVAALYKLPGLDEDERAGWEEVARLLDGRPREDGQGDLFQAAAEPPAWAQVDLGGVRVERVRDFGKVYVALALWRRLGLHRFFGEQVRRGREGIDWATVTCILGVERFCDQGAELALGERGHARTALGDLLGVDPADVYDNRLYRCLDELLKLRDDLFVHLKERYQSLFGSSFEFLLYDVTSTFFEGQCARNPQAQRGYSRDQRPDCKQVCIGMAVTPEGFRSRIKSSTLRMKTAPGSATNTWFSTRMGSSGSPWRIGSAAMAFHCSGCMLNSVNSRTLFPEEGSNASMAAKGGVLACQRVLLRGIVVPVEK